MEKNTRKAVMKKLPSIQGIKLRNHSGILLLLILSKRKRMENRSIKIPFFPATLHWRHPPTRALIDKCTFLSPLKQQILMEGKYRLNYMIPR